LPAETMWVNGITKNTAVHTATFPSVFQPLSLTRARLKTSSPMIASANAGAARLCL